MKPNRLNRFSLLCSLICYLIVCCPPTLTAQQQPREVVRILAVGNSFSDDGVEYLDELAKPPASADRREPLHRGLLAGAPLGERQQGTSRIRLPQELRRRAVQHPQDLPPVGIAGRTVGLHYGSAGQPEFRPIRHLLPLHALPAAIPAHTRNQSRSALRHPSGSGLMPAIPTIRDLRITTTTNPECIGKSSKRSTGSPAKSTFRS